MSDMDVPRTPMDPAEAARRFAGRLAEAGLPCFASAAHDVELDLLKVTWRHGVTLYMDLTREGFLDPIDAHGRAVILGLRPCCEECAKLDVAGSGGSEDVRAEVPIPGCWGRSFVHSDDGTADDG
jgi:hypothetical protein